MERFVSNTSLTREHEVATKFGVAVFILDDKNRIFTTKELENKSSTGKVAGEYSVICETQEPNEDWLENLQRGLEEELGIPRAMFPKVFDLSELIVWESGFVDGVWATVIKINCKDSDLLIRLIGTLGRPDKMEILGWKTKEEFKGLQLRRGVGNILAKFEDEIFS
ncbi:MAG TPA: NUDIX hydrolase [Patescibacteria group bacterium]|nr:NUDIX hydrolase [Patescibacteria group bacterium]